MLRLSFFFISLNVSSHYAVLSLVGLIHASSIVSSYVLPFVLYIISYMVSIIYMYEHIVYIVDTELYCSLVFNRDLYLLKHP